MLFNENLHISSSRTPLDRFREDQADSGAFRAVRLSRRRHWVFKLVWVDKTKLQADEVLAFWDRTHENSFLYNYPLDGKTYTCYFNKPPNVGKTSFNLWRIEVEITGQKQ